MLKENEIEVIVEKAVQKTFLVLGIDISDPEGILSLQKDMHHLRTDRVRKDAVVNRSLFHLTTMAVSAVVAAIVLGAMQFFSRGS